MRTLLSPVKEKEKWKAYYTKRDYCIAHIALKKAIWKSKMYATLIKYGSGSTTMKN